MECLSCRWRGNARDLKLYAIRKQDSPQDHHEKVCPRCKSFGTIKRMAMEEELAEKQRLAEEEAVRKWLC
jgi:hypothetical protein